MMKPEYDFSEGVRGKYAKPERVEVRLVMLDPDAAEIFPDSDSVNRALRVLAEAARALRETDVHLDHAEGDP